MDANDSIAATKLFTLSSVHFVSLTTTGGFFRIHTMCGEVTNDEWKKDFDPESRCMVIKEIARRYIGLADDIRAEIKKAGFQIKHWEILYRKDKYEQDDMLVDTIIP